MESESRIWISTIPTPTEEGLYHSENDSTCTTFYLLPDDLKESKCD